MGRKMVFCMKVFKGIAGAPGIVAGGVLYFEKTQGKKEDISVDEAVQRALLRVRELHEKVLSELGEDKAKIFSAYEMLLSDNMLTDPIKEAISQGMPTDEAVTEVTDRMASVLEKKDNEYMRQRADDIRYIGQLLTDVFNGTKSNFTFPNDGKKYILAARELTPVDTMSFDNSRLAGLITELGGAASHTVILAKSIGIPAVVGAHGLKEADGAEEAYLDGYDGVLVTMPDNDKKAEYEEKLSEEADLKERLKEIKASDAYTKDGERIFVSVNIGNPSDLKEASDEKFDGVGLFRSEFLYSSVSKKPDIEEQRKAYNEVIERISPDVVTIRTLDAGGDKEIEYLNMEKEENPFLGNRGIRLCLNNPEIFSEQLEAILLAAAGKKVKIMLPMVTCAGEIKKTEEILEGIKDKLSKENKDFCKDYSLGIMIETPASAIMAEDFSKECGFFSIGTNDLVQYIMAADRGNAFVENLYNPCHPAVIRMLNNVVSAAEKAGIGVSICGDLAANTDFTELLVGMGLRNLSVPLPMLGRIKDRISRVSSKSAKELCQKVLKARDENEVKAILKEER